MQWSVMYRQNQLISSLEIDIEPPGVKIQEREYGVQFCIRDAITRIDIHQEFFDPE
jgi:hypothetical protein